MPEDEHARLTAIPHERIRDEQDRSWTMRLLDVALDPDADHEARLEALETLSELDDPRALAPLTELMEDIAVADELRDAAADGVSIDTTPAQRAAWWASGDDVLMAHAISLMERGEGELVAEVAGDDDHPLQADALRALSRDFDEPRFHALLIEALGHPDDDVRLQAARTLLWDEPVGAEDALILAAGDRDEAIAMAAIHALGYYSSRRTLRALTELSTGADDRGVRSAAGGAAEVLAEEQFGWGVRHLYEQPAAAAHLRRWLEPVADLVPWPQERPPGGAAPERGAPARSDRVTPPCAEVEAALCDLDRPWEAMRHWLVRIDWAGYAPAERSALRQLLLEHGDREVRAIAALALGVWRDQPGLLRLVADRSRGVRQSAVYALGEQPRDPLIADPLWDAMLVATGIPATEALSAYVAHAPAPEARTRLVRLAREDRRADVRQRAVVELERLKARDEIASLADLLYAAPYGTWTFHSWLIDAIAKLGLPSPNLEHLLDVDQLHLQLSIGRLLARDALS
ncbi:MAG: HEAT repeat domain-containing protein [Patulibacter minatonensis]